MPLFAKRSGVHKEMTDCKVKVGGEWKQALEMLVKVNGKWKQIWKNITVLLLNRTEATSKGFTIPVSGVTSSSNKITLENVRFVIQGDEIYEVITYDLWETPYSGAQITYTLDNGATGAYVSVTPQTDGTVILRLVINRNSIDELEFSFTKIYKSN